MEILWAVIIGLVAGLIAKAIMPGKDPGGFVITAVIGIVGAVIFTFLGRALGFYEEGESAGLIGAVIGAILLLWLYRMFAGRSRRTI